MLGQLTRSCHRATRSNTAINEGHVLGGSKDIGTPDTQDAKYLGSSEVKEIDNATEDEDQNRCPKETSRSGFGTAFYPVSNCRNCVDRRGYVLYSLDAITD